MRPRNLFCSGSACRAGHQVSGWTVPRPLCSVSVSPSCLACLSIQLSVRLPRTHPGRTKLPFPRIEVKDILSATPDPAAHIKPPPKCEDCWGPHLGWWMLTGAGGDAGLRREAVAHPPPKPQMGKRSPLTHILSTKTPSPCCCRWPPAFSWTWRCLGAGTPGSQRRRERSRRRGTGAQSPGSWAASVIRWPAELKEPGPRQGRGRRQRPLAGERGGHCFSRAAENYLVGEGGRGPGAAHQSLLLYFAIKVKQSQKKLLFLSEHIHTPNRQVNQWKALTLSEPACVVSRYRSV